MIMQYFLLYLVFDTKGMSNYKRENSLAGDEIKFKLLK